MDYYNNLFARQRDSLIKELNKHPRPDTNRVHALLKVIGCGIFLSQKKQLLPYWQEALTLTRRLKDKKAEADCLEWRGGFYKSAQKTDSAFIYLDSAIEATGPSPEGWLRETKAFALFEKGVIFEYQENFYTALNNYFESLELYNGANARQGKMISLRVADIYKKLNNDDRALEYYQQSLKFYEASAVDKTNTEAEGIYTYIARIYLDRGDLVNTKVYLGKLKAFMPDTTETIETGGFYHLAGSVALKENKPDSAILLLKEALKYFEYTEQTHEDDIANLCADLARLHLQKNSLADAKKYADKSLAAANLSEEKEVLANALGVMAEYFDRTGSYQSAYDALHRASILSDSVLAESNVKQAATLSAIYENGKKENAIAQLEADKRIQSAEVKQKSLLNTIFIITIVALLIISVVLYINFKNRQKIEQQKIAELEKEKQLMGIEAMLKGQEEERTRLAKDLHDGLGGMLSGVKISFSNMKDNLILDDANARVFEKSIQQLDETIAELRKVAHNLMPEALVKFGLKSAVKDFCESMQLSGGTRIICEQYGVERELGNIADVNVYRIIQELVNNAIVHGKASQVVVQLTKATTKVLITVEDNGKGFSPQATEKRRGIGLSNVQSRVNYFNGIVEIDSTPGEGSSINIELVA